MSNEIFIDGDADVTQLRVQAHTTQTNPLQIWEDSAGDALAQVTQDGRLAVGDLDLGTDDALVETNRAITLPSSVPQRGWQALGQITGAITSAVSWIVQELELLGSGGVSGLHTALRARITQKNTGIAEQAELRAGDFEAINEAGSAIRPVGKLVGVHAAVTNQEDAYINDVVGVEVVVQDGNSPSEIQFAYGVRVGDIPSADQATYAIHTGDGVVHFGDYIELVKPAATPGQPSQDTVRVYPKNDGKLYAQDWSGTERDLTAGSGITVEEEDGTPSVSDVTMIKVSNGTLTDNGNGSVSIATSAGGAGSVKHQALFTFLGAVTSGPGPIRIYNATGQNKTIEKVFIYGANADGLIVDIHQDGTTIFTTQANRPVCSGQDTGESTSIDVTTWAAGSRLTAEIDAAAGSNVVVHVVYY
jgi:hypothetical protein